MCIIWLCVWKCRDEIQRIKAGNPDISHREAFSAAAKNVSLKKIRVSIFTISNNWEIIFKNLFLVCTLVGPFSTHPFWSHACWSNYNQEDNYYCVPTGIDVLTLMQFPLALHCNSHTSTAKKTTDSWFGHTYD